ncbi:MAG: DUF427 domain-containing protein [Acidobacteriota bacterium]|nr:DUF427 domain-containing protein [Acidobacteriota bacterium]
MSDTHLPRESVWDYPRPPRLEPTSRRVRVVFAGCTVAETRNALRLLETSHPPTYYLPPGDVDQDLVVPSQRRTFCEFKGTARYVGLRAGDRRVADAGWFYPDPTAAYEALRDHLAFYPSKVDACFVDDHRVEAQEGDFYGGWITPEIVGPFKGGAGTWGW